MPRADFYLIVSPRFRGDPLRLVCELTRDAYADGWPTLILARDRAQAEALDDALWSVEAAYLPHQVAGRDEDDAITPILIAEPGCDPAPREVQINLRETAVAQVPGRVLEVVPVDREAREPLRQRWRAYAARGLEVVKHES